MSKDAAIQKVVDNELQRSRRGDRTKADMMVMIRHMLMTTHKDDPWAALLQVLNYMQDHQLKRMLVDLDVRLGGRAPVARTHSPAHRTPAAVRVQRAPTGACVRCGAPDPARVRDCYIKGCPHT